METTLNTTVISSMSTLMANRYNIYEQNMFCLMCKFPSQFNGEREREVSKNKQYIDKYSSR